VLDSAFWVLDEALLVCRKGWLVVDLDFPLLAACHQGSAAGKNKQY